MGSCNILGAFSSGGGGGGVTTETVSDTITSSFTSTDTSLADITGWTLTKPDITDGKCFISAFCTLETDTGGNNVSIAIEDDGAVTSQVVTQWISIAANVEDSVALSDVSDAGGETIQMQAKCSGGTLTVKYSSGTTVPKVVCLGVG